jgi:hypothetical protein
MCAYVLDARNNTAFETEYPENYTGENFRRLTIKAGKAAIKRQAIERLRAILKPGDTVHTVLRNVSRSGMMRHIDVYKMSESGPVCLSGYVAEALDMTRADSGALKVSGCGMDMGFSVVYNLGSVLYGKFYNGAGWRCIGGGCPSNEHSGLNYGKPRDGKDMHEDGGYALRQTWL